MYGSPSHKLMHIHKVLLIAPGVKEFPKTQFMDEPMLLK